MDDSKIISLFQGRSEQAIDALAQKYGALCKRISYNITNSHEDAEECVNDAYLAVWNTVPPQNPTPLASYVCRIVRNLSIKRYQANRAAKRNSQFDIALEELEDCFSDKVTVENVIFSEDIAAVLNSFLASLTQNDRILFVRRYWFSDSITTLAVSFQTNKHNISVRLSRLRKKLKKYLTEKGVCL